MDSVGFLVCFRRISSQLSNSLQDDLLLDRLNFLTYLFSISLATFFDHLLQLTDDFGLLCPGIAKSMTKKLLNRRLENHVRYLESGPKILGLECCI